MISVPLIFFCVLFLVISASNGQDHHTKLTSWMIATKSGESAKVSLNAHTATLESSIQIEFDRRGCSSFQQMNLSAAAKTNNFLKNRFGPDEMVLFLEGPSIQAFLIRQRNCTFYFQEFNIPIEGDYRLKVAVIRSNYSAATELVDLCPRPGFDLILDTQVHLTKNIRAPSTKEFAGYWFHKTPELSLLKNKTMQLDTKKYIRDMPISSWVSVSSNPVTEVIANQVYSCAEDISNYEWKLTDPQQVVLTSTQGSAILSGKKILMIGDSHARTLSAQILSWACGMKIPEVRHVVTFHSVPLTASRCAGYQVTFRPELFCGLGSLPPLGQFDLVVSNCGHHPASYRHSTLGQYTDMVTKLADEVISKGYKNDSFAWIESIPQPLRNNRWFAADRDWRTFHRLDLFNQFANEIMTRSTKQKNDVHEGFTVIPAFQNLLPFSDKLCDNSHYTTPDIYVPVYQSLLKLLNKPK